MKKVLEIAKDFVQVLKENINDCKSQVGNFRILQYFRAWRTLYLNKQETQKRLIKLDNFGKFLVLRFFKVTLITRDFVALETRVYSFVQRKIYLS